MCIEQRGEKMLPCGWLLSAHVKQLWDLVPFLIMRITRVDPFSLKGRHNKHSMSAVCKQVGDNGDPGDPLNFKILSMLERRCVMC